MRFVTLNNGVQMPILGFGVYQIPPDQTEQAVTDALATGYRHLDTAEGYQNEEAVGRAMGRIAAMDTGASLFFDHRDPEIVSQIGNRGT